MDGTGSGWYPMAGFGITGVEPSGYGTRYLISKIDLREIGREGGRWMKLAQDCVQWGALVLAALSLRVLLPESYVISKMHITE
jgi:hypothetical protein